jgi:hypothetical protein
VGKGRYGKGTDKKRGAGETGKFARSHSLKERRWI